MVTKEQMGLQFPMKMRVVGKVNVGRERNIDITGETITIGSKYLVVSASRMRAPIPSVNSHTQLILEWPAQLEDATFINLVLTGFIRDVMETQQITMLVEVGRHVFKTRSKENRFR